MSWLRYLHFLLMYFRQPPWDTQVSPPELIEFIENNPAGRALDLGCGTGTNVITLAKHGWQVVGVDFIKRAIHNAKLKAEQAGISAEFLVDDVTQLGEVQGVFDLVLDIGCFHSLDSKGKNLYISNLKRLTRPGSTFLIYGFLRDSESGGPGIDEFDLKSLGNYFNQLKREEGTDRGQRKSVWLTYQRKIIEGLQGVGEHPTV